MVRKTDMVRTAVREEDWKKALRIAKDFRINVTQEQRRTMSKAYECMIHERFYLSIGEDIKSRIAEGIETLISIFGKTSH